MRVLLTTLILMLFTLTGFCQQRIVKKCTETRNSIYKDTKGEELTEIETREFIVYDKQGREIERGTFGESFGTMITTDSSTFFYCGQDYTKIRSVDFKTYDQQGREIRQDTWDYKNNKKDKLQKYIIAKYDNHGNKSKSACFSKKGATLQATTYIYDKNSNNISTNDSTFISFLDHKTTEVKETRSQFDSLNRVTMTIVIIDQKLVSRKFILYQEAFGNVTTELTYYSASDISLRSINEIEAGSPYFGCESKKIKEYYKPINTVLESEDRRTLYTYNHDCLLEKAEYYSGLKLTGYSKFDYEFY